MVDPLHRRRRAALELQRHAIEADDTDPLRRAADQQREVEIGDRRRIQHAPELPLARLHLELCRRIVRIGHRHEIDGEVLRRLAEAGAGIGDVAVTVELALGHDRLELRRRRVRVDEILVADHEHALGQAGELWIGALDAFDDDGAGSSAEHLRLAEAVQMRVIPIEAGRRVVRNPQAIVEWRVVGLDRGLQHVVLVTDRRHAQPVEVQIGRDRRHRAARAGVDLLSRRADRRAGECAVDRRRRVEVDQVVLEMDDELVARLQPQRRRRLAIRCQVAVAGRSVGQLLVVDGEVGFQHAVAAAHFHGLRDRASGLGPRTDVLSCLRCILQTRCTEPGRHAARGEPEACRGDDTTNGRKSSCHAAPPMRRHARASVGPTSGVTSFHVLRPRWSTKLVFGGARLAARCCGNLAGI